MLRKTAAKTNEPSGYVEIGTYLFNNPGKSSVKTLTSVNKPLKLDTADEIKQVKKIRVETRVVEDTSVEDGKVYQKDVETIQTSGDGDSSDPSTSTNFSTGADSDDTPVSDDFKRWTKNIVDKCLDTNNLQWVAIVALGGIALLTLGLLLGR